jgi:hypothetical protein
MTNYPCEFFGRKKVLEDSGSPKFKSEVKKDKPSSARFSTKCKPHASPAVLRNSLNKTRE